MSFVELCYGDKEEGGCVTKERGRGICLYRTHVVVKTGWRGENRCYLSTCTMYNIGLLKHKL